MKKCLIYLTVVFVWANHWSRVSVFADLGMPFKECHLTISYHTLHCTVELLFIQETFYCLFVFYWTIMGSDRFNIKCTAATRDADSSGAFGLWQKDNTAVSLERSLRPINSCQVFCCLFFVIHRLLHPNKKKSTWPHKYLILHQHPCLQLLRCVAEAFVLLAWAHALEHICVYVNIRIK